MFNQLFDERSLDQTFVFLWNEKAFITGLNVFPRINISGRLNQLYSANLEGTSKDADMFCNHASFQYIFDAKKMLIFYKLRLNRALFSD